MTGSAAAVSPASTSGLRTDTPVAVRLPTTQSIAKNLMARELSMRLNHDLHTLVAVSWRARYQQFEVTAAVPGPLLRQAATRCAAALALDPTDDLLVLSDHETFGQPLTMMIAEDRIGGGTTLHCATPCNPGDQNGRWEASWLPGWHLDRYQAITAMVLAETVAVMQAHGPIQGIDFDHRMWPHIDSFAAELGLTGMDALRRTCTDPADPVSADESEPRGAR